MRGRKDEVGVKGVEEGLRRGGERAGEGVLRA